MSMHICVFVNSYERECLRIKRKCARICKYLAYLSLISAYVRPILCFSAQLFRVCIFAGLQGGLRPLRFNAPIYLSNCLSIFFTRSVFFSCSLFSSAVKTDRNDDLVLARHEHPINHLRARKKNQRCWDEGREEAATVVGNWMLYGVVVAIISANCLPLPGNYRPGAIGTRSF